MKNTLAQSSGENSRTRPAMARVGLVLALVAFGLDCQILGRKLPLAEKDIRIDIYNVMQWFESQNEDQSKEGLSGSHNFLSNMNQIGKSRRRGRDGNKGIRKNMKRLLKVFVHAEKKVEFDNDGIISFNMARDDKKRLRSNCDRRTHSQQLPGCDKATNKAENDSRELEEIYKNIEKVQKRYLKWSRV